MTLLLADLVTQVVAQMETSGFTQLTIRGYERVFNRLLRLANDRGDSYYTTELGQAFISDDSHIIPENTERYYKERTQNYIRCVRHIESYLRYGIVDWTPALHHASFPIKSLAIKASFDTFLKKMDEQGLKPNTVDGYRRFCYYFIEYLESKEYSSLAEIRRGDVVTFIAFICSEKYQVTSLGAHMPGLKLS